MRNFKYIKKALTISILITAVATMTGCKNNDSSNKYTNGYNNGSSATSGTNTTITPTTTLPKPDFDLPTLNADNITIHAGESIDYIANLTIEGAGDTDVSQISVDTSNVRPYVPGVYKAVYTVTYRGYPVTKTIVVTVTEPLDSTIPTYGNIPGGEPMGAMSVMLSSGEKCSIPCTTEHFIIESHTDDTYSTISGKTFRTSVLKITFSDGEIIELETVYNQVAAR